MHRTNAQPLPYLSQRAANLSALRRGYRQLGDSSLAAILQDFSEPRVSRLAARIELRKRKA